MKVIIEASHINGKVNAPPSKSSMLRAVAASLLAEGESVIRYPSVCNDAIASLGIAACLGAKISHHKDEIKIRGGFSPQCKVLKCDESGLAARMYSAIASLHDDWLSLEGRGSLLSRPVGMMYETLRSLGVKVEADGEYLPMKVKGPLEGGIAFIDGSISSQFLTGLLSSLPLADRDSRLIVRDLKSKPYIDLTIDVLKSFGIDIHNEDYTTFFIPGRQKYVPSVFEVEGDWSAAAMLLVSGATTDKICLSNLQISSTQADREILNILRLTGALIETRDGLISIKSNKLNAFDVDITNCPDLAPPLVALASACEGKSYVRGTNRLKVKESDRASVMEEEFSKLGVGINIFDDWIEVEGPAKITGGILNSHGDHRICMALAISALRSNQPVVIEGAESVNKSYPDFFKDLIKLGASIKIEY